MIKFGEGVCEDWSYILGREDGVVGGETSCKLPVGETTVSPPILAATGADLKTTRQQMNKMTGWVSFCRFYALGHI